MNKFYICQEYVANHKFSHRFFLKKNHSKKCPGGGTKTLTKKKL